VPNHGYSIDTNITHYDEKKRVEMVVMPSMEYKVTTLIDFNSPSWEHNSSLKTMRDFKGRNISLSHLLLPP